MILYKWGVGEFLVAPTLGMGKSATVWLRRLENYSIYLRHGHGGRRIFA